MNPAAAAFAAGVLLAGALAANEPGSGKLQSVGPGPVETAPARRIVTLSPHLAELVYSAGAGDRLVGVSAFSDFPAPVAALPQVGDAFAIDLEQLSLLEPDLLLAWQSGTPQRTVDELRRLGHPVVVIRTRSLGDVAAALKRIGRLAGSEAAATSAAERFLAELDALERRYADRSPLRVFYQVSARPLYTVNRQHFASELIGICRGRNVFADLDDLAPLVSPEAVLERQPEALLAGGRGDDPHDLEVFADWRRWQSLPATAHDNFLLVDADLIARPGLRLVAAAEQLCERLDEARGRLAWKPRE